MKKLNMNLRQFKKLCKKALPLALQLGAAKEDVISAQGDECGWIVRKGRSIDPLKGTKGFGCVSGYYEPEWDDHSAYAELEAIVFDSLTDWSDVDRPVLMSGVVIRNWRDVFKYAQMLIETPVNSATSAQEWKGGAT